MTIGRGYAAFAAIALGAAVIAAASPGAARVIDGVVAVVNDEPVTLSEVREAVSEGMGIPLGDADGYLREEKDSGRILRWIGALVDGVLVRQELAKQGQSVSEKDVDRSVASIREQNSLTEDEFVQALGREGLTLPSFRRRLRLQMERGSIVRALRLKDVIVTEDEARAWFSENAERFRVGAEARIETLHLPFPAGSGEERTVPVRIAMQRAAVLVRGGMSLEEAAKTLVERHPDATVGSSGFLAPDDLVPEIRKEIAKLRSGETSPPFFTGGGGFIVKVLERRGGTLPEFGKIRDSLVEELTDRRSEKALAEVIDSLRKSAAVDIRL